MKWLTEVLIGIYCEAFYQERLADLSGHRTNLIRQIRDSEIVEAYSSGYLTRDHMKHPSGSVLTPTELKNRKILCLNARRQAIKTLQHWSRCHVPVAIKRKAERYQYPYECGHCETSRYPYVLNRIIGICNSCYTIDKLRNDVVARVALKLMLKGGTVDSSVQ